MNWISGRPLGRNQYELRQQQSNAIADCRAMEHEVQKLKNEMAIVEKNCAYATDMANQKEMILREAMTIVNDLRDKNIKGNTAIDQIDHLAKQAVRLNKENEGLKSALESERRLHDMTIKSRHERGDEIEKQKERIVQLIKDNDALCNRNAGLECTGSLKGEVSSMCGGCLGCQLKQAQSIITQLNENVDERDDEIVQLKFQLSETQKLKAGEYNKLVQSLTKATEHYKQLVAILKDGLETVSKVSVFSRKAEAEQTLLQYTRYLDDRYLNDRLVITEKSNK